jgi:rod shape-determining protein MreB
MKLFSFLTQEIAIDLGTANTIIMHNDKVVVDQPSMVAIDKITDKVIAIGKRPDKCRARSIEISR